MTEIKDFVYTPSQEVAAEKLDKFMRKPIDNSLESRVFLLTGKAGTGKSTVIYHILKKLIEVDSKNDFGFVFGGFGTPKVIGVAPSHKAKNVLKKSIPFSKTFASTYGLKRTDNPDGTVVFKRKAKNNFGEKYPCELNTEAFVFDEISMCGNKMLQHIMNDTNKRSKIIMMGDRGQLPPIEDPSDYQLIFEDRDSPVFDLPIPETNKHELIEICRQTDGNPIIELASVVYDEIFGSQDLSRIFNLLRQELFENGIGFNTIHYNDFLDEFKGEDYTLSKVVCYRKKSVANYNSAIRQFVLDNPQEEFIPGELIYMDNTYMGNKFNLYNSDEFFISHVIPDNLDGIKTSNLMIDPMKYNYNAETVFAPVPTGIGKVKYNDQLNLFRDIALNPLTKSPVKAWGNFYKFKEMFAEVSYGYAYTGHKIQGSTYKNIFVDVNDIFTVSTISNKRKLQALYTAMTRASHRVSFLKSK